VLQKKAAERNPDEFYFKMNSSQMSKGIHKELDNGSLDNETVKLLKTQDTGYLVHKASIDMRKAEKLQSSLHSIGERRPKVHKAFVDTQEEVEEFDVAKHFDTAPELVDRSHNRPRIATLEKGSVIIGNPSPKALRKIQKEKEKAYKELGMRNRRAKKLKKTIACVQLQRSLMGKGSKRKVVAAEDNGGLPVFKWKRQRAK
jgi:U3 small nucleolar RNA-associated protein 11